MLAIELQFDEALVVKMKTAGLLHDIGKIAIDYSILDKSCQLTEKEYQEIKKHSEIGFRILRDSAEFGDIADIILSHHERVDGKGYPRGLSNHQIRLESKMLAMCDAFDAMISERPYKEKSSIKDAVNELMVHADTQFDGKLVKVFVERVVPKLDIL